MHIQRVGFFPNPHSPRIFWCGIEAPGLDELAADTDAATAALGIEREKRAFSPHLTLARIKEAVGSAATAQGDRGAGIAGVRELRGAQFLSLSEQLAANRFRVH